MAGKMLHFSDSKAKLFKCDATQHPALAKDHGVSGYPSLLVFKVNSEVEKYQESRDALSIANFMHRAAGEEEEEDDGTDAEEETSNVHEMTWDNADDFIEHRIQKQLLVCADFSESNPDYEDLMDAMHDTAEAMDDTVIVLYLDSNKKGNAGIIREIGDAKTLRDCPLMRMATFKGGFKVWMPRKKDPKNERYPLTQSGMIKMIGDWSANKLRRKMKSERLPRPSKKKLSKKKLVGHSFNDYVDNPDADVLVFIYMTGCNFCKEFRDTFNKAAKELSSKTLLFAEMKGPENDIDHAGFEYSGYPHVLLFPKDDKANPIKFEETHGDESYEALQEFLTIYADE